ncbi:MAG: hypothetical protein KDJ29_10465 [Hyphomicrobiales bacterium]|nr:hypothetical protein [Hyphomicrobiales bacterium]
MSAPNIEHDRSLIGQGIPEMAPRPSDVRVVDLRGLFSVLWRRRYSIAAVAFGFALFAAVVALCIPARYAAIAQLLVDPVGLNVLRDDLTDAPANANTALVEAESQIGVILSNDVMFEVIRRMGLEDDNEFGAPETGFLSYLIGWLKSGDGKDDRARLALLALQETVEVEREELAFVINIKVWTKDPEKSARIANTFAEVYLEKNREARGDAVRRSSEALAARLQDLRDRVTLSAERVEEYRRTNGIVDAGGLLVVDQQMQEATNELSKVNAVLDDLETRYQEILDMRAKAISPDSLSEAILSPTISELRSLLTVALAQVSTLEATLGPGHPELRAARSNVDQVESQIRAELDRIVEATRIERDRARARQKALAARVESLKGEVLGTNSAMLGLRELTRQADSDREVYEAFLKRAGELSEQQNVDTTNARLISQATPPLDKSWPPRRIIVLAAGMLGLAIGVGQALLREQFDPRINSAQQVWQETGIPVLASIPQHVLAGGRGGSVALEQFYNRVAGPPGAAAKWVLLTGTDTGRLSAMASLSLATTAVESGDRVMLIDADTAAARLSRLFGLEASSGLRDLLYRGDNISSIHSVSEEQQLWVMPAGKPVSSGNDRGRPWPLRKAINERNQPVDLVLVNGGELWSSRLHRNVAASADTVILVAENFETRTAELVQAAEQLQAAGARIGGLILVV